MNLARVDLPLYHPDIDEQGESERLKRRIRGAEAVVIGSPVYHGSYSSTFRNFHDYCSKDEFADTAVGLVAPKAVTPARRVAPSRPERTA